MSKESKKPINLSVHESSDPNLFQNPDAEMTGEPNDLNDSVHDEENVDTPIPGLSDASKNEDLTDSPIINVNRSAG